MKKLNKLFIFSIISIIIINCNTNSPEYIGLTPEIKITPNNLEPSTDIVIECSNVNMFDYPDKIPDDLITSFGGDGERDTDKLLKRYYNSRVDCFCFNQFDIEKQEIYYQTMGYAFLGIGGKEYDGGTGSSFKQKISGYKAIYSLRSNVTTSGVTFRSHYGGRKGMSFTIKYPELLTLNKYTVNKGDEVEIVSTKPFFDEKTFSQEKLNNLLNINYYIVYLTRDMKIEDDGHIKYYKYSIESSDDVFIDNGSDNVYGNFEKCPLLRKYYVTDKITPYKITFKIPSYAKSGKVHIINETGFELYGKDKSKSLIVSKPNSFAYYSTKEELIILDESGKEIR